MMSKRLAAGAESAAAAGSPGGAGAAAGASGTAAWAAAANSDAPVAQPAMASLAPLLGHMDSPSAGLGPIWAKRNKNATQIPFCQFRRANVLFICLEI